MKKLIIGSLLLSTVISSCEANKIKEESRQIKQEEKPISIPPPDPTPKLIKRPEATYSPSTENLEKKIKIAVKVSVGTDGKVFEAKAMKPTDTGFEARAESLAYHYVFEPPVYEGKSRPVTFIIAVVFNPDSLR